jgi:hypothetical protein
MTGDALESFADSARDFQDEVCDALTRLDGPSFREDVWDRPGGGRGTQPGAVRTNSAGDKPPPHEHGALARQGLLPGRDQSTTLEGIDDRR